MWLTHFVKRKKGLGCFIAERDHFFNIRPLFFTSVLMLPEAMVGLRLWIYRACHFNLLS